VWVQIDAAQTWLGPDDLRVHLEGPELHGVPGRHVGNCVYEFNFRVTIPGQYRLVAIAEHSDYDALAEVPEGRAAGEGAPACVRVLCGQRAMLPAATP
jgi:hypothetical protein